MKSRFYRSPPPQNAGRWLDFSLWSAFAASETTAHRIYSSSAAWMERFGQDLLLSWKAESSRDAVFAEWPEWSASTNFTPRRIFGKHLPERNEDRAAPLLITGEPDAATPGVAEENGMRFALDFSAGYSAGLFIDQRANRALVRSLGVRRLLNAFAYTCSFSVAAALSGAETVSIDLSRKSLDRGGENFRLNGLDPAQEKGHGFYADDVLSVLPRLARKGEVFDAIILDPPTFSRGHKGRRFQVEEDFETLLLSALELAAPRARILLSTNCTRLDRRSLENIARFSLKAARRAADFHTEPELPDIPAESAARSLWMFLK